MHESLISQIVNKSINKNQKLNSELQIDAALLEAQQEAEEDQNRLDFNAVSSDLRNKVITKWLIRLLD